MAASWGVIDWDFAHPGEAIADLAYLAWYVVPLADDRRVGEYGFTHAIDRRHRLDILCAAYGGPHAVDVVDAAIDIIDARAPGRSSWRPVDSSHGRVSLTTQTSKRSRERPSG